ncbi:hypothetical protein D3C86_1273220 [compost metagenome]
MPQTVIEGLEIVQIDHQQGNAATVMFGAQAGMLIELLAQQFPVAQLGQSIASGLVVEGLLRESELFHHAIERPGQGIELGTTR